MIKKDHENELLVGSFLICGAFLQILGFKKAVIMLNVAFFIGKGKKKKKRHFLRYVLNMMFNIKK